MSTMSTIGASREYPGVRSLVPHDGVMCLLDRVLAADDESLCAAVALHEGSLFCSDGHVGAWVGIEYMAQAVAAFAGYQAHLAGLPVRVGFLLGTRRYACAVPAFKNGTLLHVHVRRALQGDNGLGAFECRIEDGATGAELASATVTVFQPLNIDEFLQRSSE